MENFGLNPEAIQSFNKKFLHGMWLISLVWTWRRTNLSFMLSSWKRSTLVTFGYSANMYVGHVINEFFLFIIFGMW